MDTGSISSEVVNEFFFKDRKDDNSSDDLEIDNQQIGICEKRNNGKSTRKTGGNIWK